MVGTSVHYEETEGSGDWLEVDPRIVPSDEPGWDWEMQKASWRFLGRNEGWFAAEKQGVGIGFKLGWVAYLNIESKEWQIIRTASYTTPTVDVIEHGNDLLANPLGKLTWTNLFPDTTFEIHTSPDKLHEEIKVGQTARDAVLSPPYPYAAEDTALVLVYEVDWGQVPGLGDDGGDIDPDADFERQARLYLKNHQGEIITALPASRAWPESEPVDENGEPIQVSLRKRFVKKGGQHYLLVGAPVLALNALPEGTIIFDPDVDVQVAADLDDTYASAITNYNAALYVYLGGWANNVGLRFIGVNIPQGSIISVAYIQVHVFTNDDPDGNWYCQDGTATPENFDDANPLVGVRSRTTNKTEWSVTGIGTGWKQSPSILDPVQEVATDHGITDLGILGIYASGDKLYFRSHEYDDTYGAKLHIEYTAGAAGGNPWHYYAQQQ